MKRVLGLIGLLVLVIAAVVVVLQLFFIDIATLQGDDMQPALGPGATVVVRRRATPARGDLIMFEHEGRYLVRRVAALPGEKVTVRGFSALVGGQAEPTYEVRYKVKVGDRTGVVKRETAGDQVCDIVDLDGRRLTDLAEKVSDGYYVLADNREMGSDSRNVGAIPAAKIRGVVWYVWDRGTPLPRLP